MRNFCTIAAAMIAAACTAQPVLQDTRHVDRFALAAGGTLEVYSEQGIGSFVLAPAARPPARICFFHGAARPFGRREGCGKEGAAFEVDGACVRVTALHAHGPHRAWFVDYYR